ncbi:type I-D CRISPR-associated protein Cas7/Csc2 [Ectothiorhodospira lacustris]|uniref:type I-D CRISPR-associated protein Cas7/Csc2 n=1 Tax=Ectothiorhodospira lacustris TaxID=2899127 RepID=UPI001EE7858C|nr:type I-D CRISPR-associated protein Cas7/Csc2 [Ectothiorhodospira lacustris]MCG5508763.1 type I-D CRISPR-associated protein Cas7/Csc2 [Ectothiorhodospira lacustris]MCG5520554.1 type I-D CRISPR-associated protein Cas7/Csc2 [Ectothiorhodospira lacustris]
MTIEAIKPYVGDIGSMLTITQTDETKSYAQPALKNLGSAVLVVLREVISPASFRNAESEITDIDVNGRRHVRAVANKFKFGERARGLQVLRFFNAGGAAAQNKTTFYKGEKPSDKYDLNTLVFGDSANTAANKVLSVKAAAQYSDAVSIQDYADVVDTTFHNRASEDGSLWDAQRKENSSNLFERHFVKPGALLLQTIAFNGKVAPMEAVEHLLLSIGLAGAYGGATSIYGVNVRNHLVGFYAGHLERDLASPYVAIDQVRQTDTDTMNLAAVREALQASYRAAWPVEISGETLVSLQQDLITRLEAEDPALREAYRKTATQVGQYFDAWFEGIG